MLITIRLFAGHRAIVGQQALELELEEGTTVAGAWQALTARYPALGSGSVSFAVNRAYAEPDTELRGGDELACIPPVSGGAPRPILVTPEPLAPEPLVALVQTPDDGALVTFAGVVRNNFGGRRTAHLVYEAYPEMAEAVLAQIADEARARWTLGAIAIHHRTGRLEIGETAVLIVIAAPHRAEAFEAVAYIMDRIKEIAPIWKQEVWADGDAEWVGSEHDRK